MIARLDTLAPVMASAALGMSATSLGRRLTPRSATLVLTVGSVAATATAWFCLAIVVLKSLAQLPQIQTAGQWSPNSLTGASPLFIGIPIAIVLATSIAAALRTAGRSTAAAYAARRTCERLARVPTAHGVAIIEDSAPEAFAVGKRIVVTTGMIRLLDPEQRRALLAHERAHIAHHHLSLIRWIEVAAAANPLVCPARQEVEVLIERWADESAARSVGSRSLIAQTLAIAALGRSTHRGSHLRLGRGLAAAATAISRRTAAMLQPEPAPARTLLGAVVILGVVGLAVPVSLARNTERTFEAAHAQYLAHASTRSFTATRSGTNSP